MIAAAGVTGSGPCVETNVIETMRVIAGELGSAPHLPYVPILPERGPGGDAVGRTVGAVSAVSSSFSVATTPDGWRIAGADTRDMRRARSWLGEDLDAAQQQLDGFDRTMVVSLVGPWSLAAAIELTTGHRLVRDHMAVLDLTQALAQAASDYVAQVRARLPGATIVLRLDEPMLGAVMQGSIATPSGLDRYRAISDQVASERLATVVEAAGVDVLLGLSPVATPLAQAMAMAAPSGSSGVVFDFDSWNRSRDTDTMGQLIEAGGVAVLALALPARASTVSVVRDNVEAVTRWWSELGFAPDDLTMSVAIQPGSSSTPSGELVREFEALRAISAALRDEQEQGRD